MHQKSVTYKHPQLWQALSAAQKESCAEQTHSCTEKSLNSRLELHSLFEFPYCRSQPQHHRGIWFITVILIKQPPSNESCGVCQNHRTL